MQKKLTHFYPHRERIANLEKQVRLATWAIAILVFLLIVFVWGWASQVIIALQNV